ncbi:MAG: Molybdenum cofactor biosynthesis protein B [Promethearchaeota archaeon]|nr:MAG: Molybdenum cofactor biosynthesis protein B [Candidatus Lokiarchaeota archaeon]
MKVHEEHKHEADKKKKLRIALIIVSTSRFEELETQKETTDETIPLVQELLYKEAKISLKETMIIPDSADHVEAALIDYLEDKNIDAIIYSGGTGLSPKDITYETIKPKFEKIIPGFGELFRYLSYKEIGSSAMLSRAIGGKIGNKAVFLLPGSPNAVKLALSDLILPELAHMSYLITKKE